MEELWHGYRMKKFLFEDTEAILVFPEEGTATGDWAFKMEYWDAFQDTEHRLVRAGFHLAFLKNVSRWAVKTDCDKKARFVHYLADTYGLKRKCVPVGMSCGGAIAVRFAGFYPDLVSCMFIDAPVLNFCDVPGRLEAGYTGKAWEEEFVVSYPGIKRYQLFGWNEHPICMTDTLIDHKIPILMVYGKEDKTVAYEKHGMLMEQAYEGTDLLTVMPVFGRGHHPHGMTVEAENQKIADYILAHV